MEINNLNDLIEKAKQHDNDAVTQLIKATQSKLYFVALSYVKKDADAQDVLQNAYIKAFSNLNSLTDNTKFEAWITRIVSNTALDLMKKASNRYDVKFTDMQDDENLVFDTADERIDTQPELAFSKKETEKIIKEIIDSLSDEQRVVVLMYFYDGMTTKEIAEEIGCNENTVKGRIKYAKEKIKESVITIQKRDGIKLYNLAPLPFFLWLLKGYSVSGFASSVAIGTAAATTATSTATTATASSVATASTAKAAGVVAGKTIVASTVAKVAIVGAVVIGGGVAATSMLHQDKVISHSYSDSTRVYFDGSSENTHTENYYLYDNNGNRIKLAKIVDGELTVYDDKIIYGDNGNYTDYAYTYVDDKWVQYEKRVATKTSKDGLNMKIYCEVSPDNFTDEICGMMGTEGIIYYDNNQLMAEQIYYKDIISGMIIYNPDGTINYEGHGTVSEGKQWEISNTELYRSWYGLDTVTDKPLSIKGTDDKNVRTFYITNECDRYLMSFDGANSYGYCSVFSLATRTFTYDGDYVAKFDNYYTYDYNGEITEINGKDIVVQQTYFNQSKHFNHFAKTQHVVGVNELASVSQANKLFYSILAEYGYNANDNQEPENIGETENEDNPEVTDSVENINDMDLKTIMRNVGYTLKTVDACNATVDTEVGTLSFRSCETEHEAKGWALMLDVIKTSDTYIEYTNYGHTITVNFAYTYDTDTMQLINDYYSEGRKHFYYGIGGYGETTDQEAISIRDNGWKGVEYLLDKLGVTQQELYDLAISTDFSK